MRLWKIAGSFQPDWHLRTNKYRMMAAVLIPVIAGLLLVRGDSPLRESVEHYLSGEGAYGVQFDKESPDYTQAFKPQYEKLQRVGIAVDMPAQADVSGSIQFFIEDGEGQLLAQRKLKADEILSGVYTDVNVNLDLKAGKTYYMTVSSDLSVVRNPDGNDGTENVNEPELLVCSSDYRLAENENLRGEEELAGVQLLTRYGYEDALQIGSLVRTMLLILVAAIGIAVGLPADRRIRTAVAALLLAGGPCILGRWLELMLPTNVLLPHAMKWNLCIMYLFEVIVILCTQSRRFTIVFCNIVLTILYCANYFVYTFRGTYLKANELTAIGTAADVAGNYRFEPNAHMVMGWCMLAVFVAWGMCTGRAKGTEEERITEGKTVRNMAKRVLSHGITFVLGIALAMGAGYALIDTELLLEHGFCYYSGINQEYTYYFNGYLVGSMINIRYSRITEPEGYSVKKAEELLERYREEAASASEELPHVILIMNESWSDLRVNGNLELSQENLSFTYSLKENTIRGYVNASVLGGGTANSEFEVFTGCTMGFLPDSYYAYQQAVTGSTDSMVTNLKRAGYTTISMHPERALNWRRNVVYDYLGFDEKLWKEDFEGAEIIHSGVSDAETFHRVEELYENRSEGEKLFIFDLTMQNHGYYHKSNVERTVEATNVDCDEADIYLSLVYETDRAFGELVNYFEEEDEKVIICMFGDHQPKFESETFYEDIYRQTDGLTESDKRRNLYKTPFVIWANYDIPEAEGMDIGMSYLGVLLQQTAGIELTPFGRFLADQMAEYPVITVNGYVDSEGNYSNWSGTGEEFPDYRMLQYNYLFDHNIVKWGY